MNTTSTAPSAADRLHGMFLLSAYGDAFGAEHESSSTVHPAPLPGSLPEQRVGSTGHPWGYWVTQTQVTNPTKGVPTDDTAFNLFILHPWLEQIRRGAAEFGESSFRHFLAGLKSSPAEPSWILGPRNGQIDSWLKMYRAAELPIPVKCEFFIPDVPIVFGFFLLLETAAFRTRHSPLENYRYFRGGTVLDQGYAKSASGFLTAIASMAFSSGTSVGFDEWLVQQSMHLADELITGGIDTDDASIIKAIIETMSELGRNLQERSPHEFMIGFEDVVVQASRPPFMDTSFGSRDFDPFRMLAEIFAAVAYAKGDPFRAIQPLAFSSGDSDTVCGFLGTLMGIWYGAESLRQHEELSEDLDTVTAMLTQTFKVNLDERVKLFLDLQRHQYGKSELA